MTRSTPALSSRAEVATDRPARYAEQLVAHLGRKVAFTPDGTPDGPASTARLGDATGSVVVGEGVLVLLAAGPDEASLGRVEHVLGSHLERFGARDELAVVWVRGGVPA